MKITITQSTRKRQEHTYQPIRWYVSPDDDEDDDDHKLKILEDEMIGDYHTTYNSSYSTDWWDAYCTGEKIKKTPQTIDEIISTACSFNRASPDDSVEVKHRKDVRSAFERQVYNIILCQSGCCLGAMPRMKFLSRPAEEMNKAVQHYEPVNYYPNPCWHFFYIVYPKQRQDLEDIFVDISAANVAAEPMFADRKIQEIIFDYYNGETVTCFQVQPRMKTWKTKYEYLLESDDTNVDLPPWTWDGISPPPHVVNNPEETKESIEETVSSHLCPTRILFCFGKTILVWNNDEHRIEGKFPYPEQLKKEKYLEPAQPRRVICMGDVNKPTDDYLLTWVTHSYAAKESFFVRMNFETMTKLEWLDCVPANLSLVPGKSASCQEKVEKTITSEDGDLEVIRKFYYSLDTLKSRKHEVETELDGFRILSLKVGHPGHPTQEDQQVALCWEFSKAFTLRKISPTGIPLAPFAALEINIEGHEYKKSSMLYDGSIAMMIFNKEVLSFIIWSAGQVSHSSFKVEGEQDHYCEFWQLPSTSKDAEVCRKLLAENSSFSLDVINIITEYLCLTVAALQKIVCRDFGNLVQIG